MGAADAVQGSEARRRARAGVRGAQAPPLGLGPVAARAAGAVHDEDRAGQEEHRSSEDDHVDPRRSSERGVCTTT